MPIATPEVYAEMLDRAKAGAFAYPAINVTLVADAERGAAGVRRGGERRHHPGLHRRRRVPLRPDRQGHGHRLGRARRVRPRGREELPGQHRAAHRPLPEGQARRLRPAAARHLRRAGRRAARTPLFQSHMWDGSAVPLEENLDDRRGAAGRVPPPPRSSWRSRSASSAARRTASPTRSTRSSTPPSRTACATVEALGLGEKGRYIAAAHLRQRARRLQAGQRQAAPRDPQGDPGRGRRQVRQGQAVRPGLPRRLRLDRWRRSARPLDYGVVKMNIDTDTQYAFTRPVAGHMFSNYDGVLKVDGEVGNKKAYDPRAWGKAGRGRHGRSASSRPARTCARPVRR